jgi:hypothetical protein
MSDVRREVKEYNQAVVNNSFLSQRAACPCCHFPRPSRFSTNWACFKIDMCFDTVAREPNDLADKR